MVTGDASPRYTVTEPEPAEILAEFIRQHSRLGSWWRAPCFSRHPIRLQKGTVSFAGKHQAERRLRGYRGMTGSQDDYYYSTQAMSENYRRCLCKLWSRTFVAPLHTPLF